MKAILIGILLVLATSREHLQNLGRTDIYDPASYANVNEIQQTHLDLTVVVDFEHKRLEGFAILTVQAQKDYIYDLYLDMKGIDINSIHDIFGKNFDYLVTTPNQNHGDQLHIFFSNPLQKGKSIDIVIDYHTNSQQTAISWLNPEQTLGGKFPFMFTQCEAIYCRSIVPIQDTPSVKFTFDLHIKTPRAIVAKASANRTREVFVDNYRETYYQMSIPVQSYLIAIAAGIIDEAEIGTSNIWVLAEPAMMEMSLKELEELPKAMEVANQYVIPYQWGAYKIIVLPPSFPVGGMENPLLTFASPSIIVGDKSSVNVANHELAHSWSGNWVTNMNWDNFWLNEGFTVFLERKITKLLIADQKQANLTYKVAATVGNSTLMTAMNGFGMTNSFSSLTPNAGTQNPDDAFSEVPYEKGFQLVAYLESLIGEAYMSEWLKTYFTYFAKQSIKWEEMQNHFEAFVRTKYSSKDATNLIAKIDWNKWVKSPGMPPVTLDFKTQEYNDAIKLGDDYIILQGKSSPQNFESFKTYIEGLKAIFVQHLLDRISSVTKDIALRIENDYDLIHVQNPEIKYIWYQIRIKAGLETKPYAVSDKFVGSIGRMKFIVPIYKAIYLQSKEDAQRIYAKYYDFYHPMARDAIERTIGIKSGESTIRLPPNVFY